MLLEISLVLLLALLVLILATVISRRKRKDGLLVPDWKPDTIYLAQVSSLSSIYTLYTVFYTIYTVYLHPSQFPPSPGVRSISPFSLKLETWLRLANIPYINVYTRRSI